MTDIRGLLTEEDAVSPVIGIVLMVAVTVILSAAVGAFVLDIGSAVTEKSPNVAFQFESNISSGSPDAVNITHGGGDTVEAAKLTVTIDGTVAWRDGGAENGYNVPATEWGSRISSGQTLVISDTDTSTPDTQKGDTVQIIWQDGQRTSILGSWDVE